MDATARPAARAVGLALALGLAALGCEGGGAATTSAPGSATAPAGSIVWEARGDGTERATLAVPLDHDDPGGATIDLFLARRPATDPAARIGTLIVNPGGPGVGGSDLALLADRALPAQLHDRFDIVGWDPRGTGHSSPAIDCIDDLDARYAGLDTSPDDDEERAQVHDAAVAFAAACARRSGELLTHVATNDSARDIDTIRQALGEDTVSYLGFSYGSELGATWASMFPDTVRAAVLDGASDPTADLGERLVQRAAGFEAALDRYLVDCVAACPLAAGGTDPGETFDRLMAQLDSAPIASVPGRPEITRAIALQGVAQGLYDEGFWPQLSDALGAALVGDGRGVLALWDAYLLRRPDGTWPNSTEAGQVISCMDQRVRFDAADSQALEERIAVAAPRMAPGLPGATTCDGFPAPLEDRVAVTGSGAGAIVVIGTTGDPATTLESSRAMADALEDGRLVIATGNRHTSYGRDDCVDGIVHRYLIDLDVPAPETTC